MKNNALQYNSYKIIGRREIGEGNFLFDFEGKIDFLPGQFVQAAVPHYGEATFAVTSDPDNKKSFELCIHDAGNTTKQITKLTLGDSLLIRGPYGNSWPISKALGKNLLIVFGGMGIVPLRPILLHLKKYRSEFKKIYIAGGFKTDHHILFEKELLELKKDFYLKIVVEHASPKFWGEHGLITESLEKIDLPKDTLVFLCGPEVMCPYCIKVFEKKGIQKDHIYISYERRMECGIGICQHCNIGKYLVCKDGPIFRYDIIEPELNK